MKTTKEFNLQLFKNGAKAQTKLGNPVKFITISVRNELIISVTPRWGNAEQCKYTLTGKKYKTVDSEFDLEMVNSYQI